MQICNCLNLSVEDGTCLVLFLVVTWQPFSRPSCQVCFWILQFHVLAISGQGEAMGKNSTAFDNVSICHPCQGDS